MRLSTVKYVLLRSLNETLKYAINNFTYRS